MASKQNFILYLFILLGVLQLPSGGNANLVMQYHAQPVDHFGYGSMSHLKFNQRVFLDNSYIPGGQQHVINGSSPIIVLFGGEANIMTWIGGPGLGPGILCKAASHFQGLMVYIEHRFYGESVPYGSIDSAMLNPEVRGCLNSVQALADFANAITRLKSDLSSTTSPVIVMGGSYAGMLAAWFRLKYPHIAVGALSSSAPVLSILELPTKDQYCSIVDKDFKDTNRRCYERISKSWSLIDSVASQPSGLDILAQTFKTCRPLFSAKQLKDYLASMYRFVAQYNGRFDRMRQLCNVITSARDDEILQGIAGSTFILDDQQTCNNITWSAPAELFLPIDSDSIKAWEWQLCSELLANPNGCGNDSMFEPYVYNLTDHMEDCYDKYGVYPRPNAIPMSYGGKELKSVLKSFGSNILFSNGLKDPLSGASIVQDISKTIVAVNTKQGSHSLDMTFVRHDDPKWLKNQRKKELKIMSRWLKNDGGFKVRQTYWLSVLTVGVFLINFILPC